MMETNMWWNMIYGGTWIVYGGTVNRTVNGTVPHRAMVRFHIVQCCGSAPYNGVVLHRAMLWFRTVQCCGSAPCNGVVP